jgi:hypothetical protein
MSPDAKVRADVERNPNPKAPRPWIATMTREPRPPTRRHFMSREAAITAAAAFLAYNDERYVEATLATDRLHREVLAEHERALNERTEGE